MSVTFGLCTRYYPPVHSPFSPISEVVTRVTSNSSERMTLMGRPFALTVRESSVTVPSLPRMTRGSSSSGLFVVASVCFLLDFLRLGAHVTRTGKPRNAANSRGDWSVSEVPVEDTSKVYDRSGNNGLAVSPLKVDSPTSGWDPVPSKSELRSVVASAQSSADTPVSTCNSKSVTVSVSFMAETVSSVSREMYTVRTGLRHVSDGTLSPNGRSVSRAASSRGVRLEGVASHLTT